MTRSSARRRLVSLLAVALSLAATRGALAHGVAKFVNGRWFDGTRFVSLEAVYSVEGILATGYVGHVDRIVDLHGGFVVPPFADAHTHALGGPGTEDIQRFLVAGIFYVKNTNSIASQTAKIRALVNRPESVDVSWSLGGLTAPGGHPMQIYDQVAKRFGMDPGAMEGDAYWTISDERELSAKWPRIMAAAPDFVKVYLERSERPLPARDDPSWYGGHGLDPKLLPPIVARAHAAGLRVTAHVTSAADFRTAVAAGADEIAHLPLEPLTDADARVAAEHGVVVVTTVLSHRPVPAGLDVDALHRENVSRLRAAGVPLAVGTDSNHSAIDEVDRLAALGVLDPLALLKMLVEVTPSTIFPGRRIGALRAGYEANFLVLETDPLQDLAALRQVQMRFKKGHLLSVGASVVTPEPPKAEHSR